MKNFEDCKIAVEMTANAFLEFAAYRDEISEAKKIVEAEVRLPYENLQKDFQALAHLVFSAVKFDENGVAQEVNVDTLYEACNFVQEKAREKNNFPLGILQQDAIKCIEHALCFTLSPWQKDYIFARSPAPFPALPRGSGKTTAHIIRLLLSPGGEMDLSITNACCFADEARGLAYELSYRKRVKEIYNKLKTEPALILRKVIF